MVISEKLKKEICFDYTNGIIQSELVDKYGISKPTIQKILKDYNVWKPKYKTKENEIIEKYKQGVLVNTICSDLNISANTVYDTIKRNDVGTKRLNNEKKSIELEDEILHKYNVQKMSIKKIEKECNLPYERIKNIILSNDIEIVKTWDLFNNPNLDNRYFLNINTPEKAYWLGWIFTDGCVTKDYLQFRLQPCDKPILELLKYDLKADVNVGIVADYASFMIGSKIMAGDLKQYGIIPNKTHVVMFPKNVPEEYMNHFLRGCFDGDGGLSIGVRKSGQKYYELSFTGTYDMVLNFRNILVEKLNVPNKKIEPNGSMKRVRWSAKSDCIKILEYLYENADDHKLERKYKKYLECKGVNHNKLFKD